MKLKYNTETFIKKAKEVHGDKYDYSKVEYVNCETKVCIICHEKDENGNEHGEFWTTPKSHLKGRNCYKCSINIRKSKCRINYKPNLASRHKKTKEEFINDAKKIHGDKYDYSKVDYINNKTSIIVICPIHGEFIITPSNHLKHKGCPKCAIDRLKKLFSYNNEDFIKKAKEVHGDKYDYSKVNYINSQINIVIICPIHGEFKQLPSNHLQGCGCPFCNSSKLEKDIKDFLIKNNITFKEQVHARDFKWLGRLSLDFYLPKYNVAIECQGIQHFNTKLSFWKTKKNLNEILNKIKERDLKKKKLCEENGIIILYYSNLGIEYPYYVFEDKEKLLEEIKKH